MQKPLTEENVKELKYQCRMGYLIPAMIFLFGTICAVIIYEGSIKLQPAEFDTKTAFWIAAVFFVIAFFVAYKMNRKYIRDIRGALKEIEVKKIQKKEQKRDFEAGSTYGMEAVEFQAYYIIVDNFRYRVEEHLFANCEEDDEVLFHYAPQSRFLLEIALNL